MSEQSTVAMFKDKRADELTRDELIVAYTYAVRELHQMRQFAREARGMEQLFADTRRRLVSHG